MIPDLTGRTAVVTGAANGIGLAIADRCAERGMRVLLADIDDGECLACGERFTTYEWNEPRKAHDGHRGEPEKSEQDKAP